MEWCLYVSLFNVLCTYLVRLKDLLKTGHQTDNPPSERDQVTDVLPNKETPDHTHWVSGDDTDSDWASPVQYRDYSNQKLSQKSSKTRKGFGTKRSLFSSQGDSSLEQLVKRPSGKYYNITTVIYGAKCSKHSGQ